MTYKEARVYLDDLSKYGSVLGLDTIRELLRELGNPQDDLKFIHIAGTNGKGSVLAYTSTILSEAGYRTGRYVSPTVVSYLERIQVNGEWISETEFAVLTEKIRDAIARMKAGGKTCPTVFETETAIAFLYFKKCKCDFVVLEAGLGGALDATNVITNTVCAVFSSISMDHIGVIGNTLEEIASDKSGIIKPGCTVISGRQQDKAGQILRDKADSCNAEYFPADPDLAEVSEESWKGISFSYKEFKGLKTTLGGVYQKDNAVTALEVIRSLRKKGFCIPDKAVSDGIRKTKWPGRFSCLGEKPVFLIDGAHNEDAAMRLRETLEMYFPGKRPVLILGVFHDKEYKKIAKILCPLAKAVYIVNLPDAARGLPAEKLAKAVRPYCKNVFVPEEEGKDQTGQADGYNSYACMQIRSVEQAVRKALDRSSEEDVILACGSLSWIWQAKEAYDRKKGAKNDKS